MVNNSKEIRNIEINSLNEMLIQQQLLVAGKCDMCKERIESAAKLVEGVKKAEWNAEKQLLSLSFDSSKTSIDVIAKAVAAVGHDTEKFKAPDAIYKQLPECCLYRGN